MIASNNFTSAFTFVKVEKAGTPVCKHHLERGEQKVYIELYSRECSFGKLP